jgi:hypothetical protein
MKRKGNYRNAEVNFELSWKGNREGARGGAVVKALCYKPEGRGIDSSGFGGLGVCMLVTGTQGRGFAPDRSRRIFPAGKIYSMPSFGRGSKIICPMLVTRTTKKVKNGQNGQLGKKKKSRWCQNFSLTGRTMALGSTQPLTEMSTRNVFWE